jgi:hypothetical protein
MSDLPLQICALLMRAMWTFFSTKVSHVRRAASDLRAVTTCVRTMVEIFFLVKLS